MNLIESVEACFTKYASFDGRAGMSEFWWFFLFVSIGPSVAAIISPLLSTALSLGTLVPFTAVTTRRLHDTNKSGWFQLGWSFASVVGLALCIYGVAFQVIKSTGKSDGFPIFALSGAFILLASAATFIYFMIAKGDVVDNLYGAPPAD